MCASIDAETGAELPISKKKPLAPSNHLLVGCSQSWKDALFGDGIRKKSLALLTTTTAVPVGTAHLPRDPVEVSHLHLLLFWVNTLTQF
jgi:hypothetical protein